MSDEQKLNIGSEFQNILNDVAEEYANAEVFDNWMPPDGDYTVLLTKLQLNKVQKGDAEYLWVRLIGRILLEGDTDLDQREYAVGNYRTTAIFTMKGDVAILNGGRKVNDINESLQVLNQAATENWVVTSTVVRTKSKKDGRIFANSSITEIVDHGTADAAETTGTA